MSEVSNEATKERGLPPKVVAALGESNDDRIRFVRGERIVKYAKSEEILDDLTALMSHPPKNRMPCRLLIARTNNGKTEVLRQLMRRHPADPNPDGEAINLPILHAELVEPDERHLYIELLKGLFQSYPPKSTTSERREQLISVLSKVRPRMIVLDEVNTLINGTVRKQRACLNALKHISNTVSIPIVAAGTQEAQYAFRTEPQIENRFEVRTLPLWTYGVELRRLLASFERSIPLRKPSNLADAPIAKQIANMTDGTIGEIGKLIEAAAIFAIKSGAEQITTDVLQKCSYMSPSARKASFNDV